jgi:hypothetical protein
MSFFSGKSERELKYYTTNELLTELLKRGEIPLFPANEEDEAKINLFKCFWQKLSVTEISAALSQHSAKAADECDADSTV